MNLTNDFFKEINLKNGHQLILRKPTIDDAENMIEYLNIIGGESDNLLFGKGEFHLTIEEEKEYIKNLVENTFMILGIIDNKIVSVAKINSLTRKRVAHNSTIGISVKKDYWRSGVGSAIMTELIKYAKGQYIKNISLGVKKSNVNAIKLYEKFGFKKIGEHQNYFNINGVFDDELLMDLYL